MPRLYAIIMAHYIHNPTPSPMTRGGYDRMILFDEYIDLANALEEILPKSSVFGKKEWTIKCGKMYSNPFAGPPPGESSKYGERVFFYWGVES